jgi:Protein of unknown function (DUF2778)
MINELVASEDFIALDDGRPPRQLLSYVLSGFAAVAASALVGGWILHSLPAANAPTSKPASAPAILASNPYGALVDPGFSRNGPSQSPALTIGSAPNPPPSAPPMLTAAVPVPDVPSPLAKPVAPPVEAAAPLPPARPAEFASPANPPRRLAQGGKTNVAPADDRNFFQKLFGLGQPAAPAGQTLAYAAAENPSPGVARSIDTFTRSANIAPSGGDATGPSARYDRWTAVYDVAGHTVYLPNGTKLEAHSGLGDRMDDPNHVSERNRGATPPHVYELQPREESFHGVEALRMTPIGGGDIFGRAGLLTHSYMLGPNGDSNGCVSFKDYEAFLQAYHSGQVKRLAVVARLD